MTLVPHSGTAVPPQKKDTTMLRMRKPITLAATLGAASALALTDPTLSDGERALLGRRPAGEVSNLRLTESQGPAGADRALLGQLASGNEAATSSPTIRVRSHNVGGASALLGQ
jgi:hypothetical protein